ncbi:TIGR02757 family protein [Rurimicrobium arvi]|uniref:TIGR02757 family protein n=1 Tax=Rurimicrobium arvi TaxID=2049916 RepID=A0ABP8MGF5_9BACT
MEDSLRLLLEAKAKQYNQPGFIQKDPVSVPRRFQHKQDIEIAALFAAVLAWGNRTAIINSSNRIMDWMDNAPHAFILHHNAADLKPMLQFAHRTFNATDLLYFILFLRHHYTHHESLEAAFVPAARYRETDTGPALIHFHNYFFSLEHPERTRKHIATPQRQSACKRINMFLRWMVRQDDQGVDFGLWKKIKPAQLVCPLDVHVAQVAFRFGLLPDTKSNWKNAVALTEQLRSINEADPCLYDFALFGLGAEERFR